MSIKILSKSAFLGVSLLASLQVHALDIKELQKRVVAAQPDYDSAEKQSLNDLKNGDLASANARLKNLVPDSMKSEVDYFILGNMLFKIDKDASDKYMKLAEAADPDNPAILYERAIREHRRGNYAAAASYYEKVNRSPFGADNPISWAYLTHCYLRMNRYNDALAAWSHVDFGSHHTAIEEAMYEIFGDDSPMPKRADLIAHVKTGDANAFYALINLDQHWEQNWWNISPNQEFLDHDAKYADTLFKSGSRDHKIFDLYLAINDLDKSALASKLDELGFWGRQKQLPPSSDVAYAVVREMVAKGIANEKDILDAYEPALLEAHQKQPEDQNTIDLLTYLYSATHQQSKLLPLDAYGWHVLKLPKYAASYIMAIASDNGAYQGPAQQAAHDFPNDLLLAKIYFSAQKGSPEELAATANMVAAKFSSVAEEDPPSMRNYMDLLNDTLHSHH